MSSLAYFVSPHGFGHAARACAVMEELARFSRQFPAAGGDLRFEIFTTVPPWFFAESMTAPFNHHVLDTDVGFVQKTSLEEDLPATVQRLRAFFPPSAEVLATVAGQLRRLGCRAVVCDISPLGLLASREAGLPGVLVENFTWDWIYGAYLEDSPELADHVSFMAEVYNSATLRVQTAPTCAPLEWAHHVCPVSRAPRASRSEVRRRLEVPDSVPLVLVTMGGVRFDFGDLRTLTEHRDASFVVPGGAETVQRLGQLIALPHHSPFYHPDLVHASDLVVGKLGYSTVAEIYHSRASCAFVGRPRFPESPVLADFVVRELGAIELEVEELASWCWVDRVDELLASRVTRDRHENGTAEVAQRIIGVLDGDV